jgi:hypothetical protein
MSMSNVDPLIGCWRIARTAGDIADGPVTEIEFLTDTEADYCVELQSGWFVMQMRWRRAGDVLVFDMYFPGKSPEDRWRFRLAEDGALIISKPEGMAWLHRAQRTSPPRQAGPHWKGGNRD